MYVVQPCRHISLVGALILYVHVWLPLLWLCLSKLISLICISMLLWKIIQILLYIQDGPVISYLIAFMMHARNAATTCKRLFCKSSRDFFIKISIDNWKFLYNVLFSKKCNNLYNIFKLKKVYSFQLCVITFKAILKNLFYVSLHILYNMQN